jgi:hypothetical protein
LKINKLFKIKELSKKHAIVIGKDERASQSLKSYIYSTKRLAD